MKKLALLILILLIISCSGNPDNNAEIIVANPYLIGKWTGEGSFLNSNFSKEFGTVKIEIIINADNNISVSIEDAQISNAIIEKADYGFDISGVLNSKIKKSKGFDKDHFILLLVLPEENRKDATHSDANFHLKSNFIFDFSMKVGGVYLSKEP